MYIRDARVCMRAYWCVYVVLGVWCVRESFHVHADTPLQAPVRACVSVPTGEAPLFTRCPLEEI